MVFQNWIEALTSSFYNLWLRVAGFLPSLVGALITIVVGIIVAAALEKLVERIVFYLKLDNILKQVGMDSFMQRGNMKLNSGNFLGRIVYWFFILVFFLAASDILGFTALSGFIQGVLSYIPNVIIASLILLAAMVAAKFVKHFVRASVMGVKMHSGKTLGEVAWWGVVVFGFLAALSQLGVAVQIINTLITGLVAMLAIAGGLAFGLGGKDHADKWISRMKDEFDNHS